MFVLSNGFLEKEDVIIEFMNVLRVFFDVFLGEFLVFFILKVLVVSGLVFFLL